MIESRDRGLLGAFVLSGAAGLGYEVLWTRLLALALGSESLGILGVLAGFFGGMALGAAALHQRARTSADPIGMFMRLELTAAAFAVVSPFWLHMLAGWLPAALGTEADNLGLTIAAAAVALLPGTFCLGATLPALVEARRRVCPDDPDGRGLGRLYAANTLGAVIGVLLTVHLLLRAGGIIGSAIALAGLGIAAAVVARRWGTAHDVPSAPAAEDKDEDTLTIDTSGDPDPDVANEPWLLLALLAGTGLAGVGLEVIAIQILSQLLENTIFTFAHVLAVYLLGTAAGAALYTRYASRAIKGRPAIVTAALLVAHAVATVGAAVMLGLSPAALFELVGADPSYAAELWAEAALAALVLGPATLLMGALFSHVAGLIAPRGIGHAYALNTLGGAIAPFVFGVYAIESLGYRDALFTVVYTYLVLFGGFTWFRRFKPTWQIGSILGVVALTGLAPSSLRLVTATESLVRDVVRWEVVESKETLLGAVVVTEKVRLPLKPPNHERKLGPPQRRLQVGQEFKMGGREAFGEQRMGQIPLLLHPEPRRALFLGVGTGATLGAVRTHASLTHVDAVELVPAVIDMLHHFSDINGDITNDDRVTFHAADARRFVAASIERYDVIVADLFHPGRDGAGNLYAREHFENIERRLAEGGLFAQWIPLYQHDPQSLRVVLRTFCDVFDEVHSVLGIYNVETPAIALIGRDSARSGGTLTIDSDQLSKRLTAAIYRDLLIDPHDLMGAYLLDRDALLSFAGEGPRTTDLSPWISVFAPRSAYEESDTRGRDNLMELVGARVPMAWTVTGPDPETFEAEAETFALALGHFLRGQSTLLDHTEQLPALLEAAPHLLEAYRTAPRFRPARGTLITAAFAAPALAERIFPVMFEITPNDRVVWDSYINYLKMTRDPRLPEAWEQRQRALGLPEATQP